MVEILHIAQPILSKKKHIAQPKHLVQVKEDNLDEVMGPDNAMC